MRKILIPTDLSVRSLELIHAVPFFYPNEMVEVVLVYPYGIPLWGSKLYWFSKSKVIDDLTKEKFHRKKSAVLKKYFRHIHNIEIQLLIGKNSYAFQKFREYHQINDAILPQEKLKGFDKNYSFDVTGFIEKNIKTIYRVTLNKHREPNDAKPTSIFKQLFGFQNSGPLRQVAPSRKTKGGFLKKAFMARGNYGDSIF